MKRAVAIVITVMLLITVPALCIGVDGEMYVRKDPILAAALSWYIPGLGQLYSGAVLKGVLFWVVENSLLVAAVVPFVELKLDVTGNMGVGVNLKSKDNIFASNEQRVALTLGVALAVVHIINIIDAVNTTRDYNIQYEEQLYTNLQYDCKSESVVFGLQGRF
jgi:TM2 domain-containing membrane protein YozV